ncbi:MAG: hypothetical protein ACLR4Z_09960 [Butyricicoccaceae bacterium]
MRAPYKAVAQADQLLAVYSHYDDVDDACRAAKGPLFNKNDFLTELERPDTVDRFSMIYAPLALALSIIFALVSSLGRGEPVRFFWAFSSITIVAAPIGLLCAFGAGYKNIARRPLASGAALAGARQANLLRGTEEVVLAENDLFPTGSIELESIKAVGQLDETRILSCAAALADAAGLELGPRAERSRPGAFGAPLTAHDLRVVDGGLTGHVGSSYMVLGTGALMVNMGVTIPAERDSQVAMYLLADNQLAGVITLRYHAHQAHLQGNASDAPHAHERRYRRTRFQRFPGDGRGGIRSAPRLRRPARSGRRCPPARPALRQGRRSGRCPDPRGRRPVRTGASLRRQARRCGTLCADAQHIRRSVRHADRVLSRVPEPGSRAARAASAAVPAHLVHSGICHQSADALNTARLRTPVRSLFFTLSRG